MEKQYLDALKNILDNGTVHNDRTGTGTIRLFSQVFRFDLSKGEFPIFTTRKLSLRLTLEELFWMLSGSTNNEVLKNKNVNIWTANSTKEECEKFKRKENDLGPIYGHQWRNFNASLRDTPLDNDYWSERNKRWVNRSYNDDGFDQIKNIVNQIETNPNSRRIIVNSFHPIESSLVNPPPCHSFFQIQVNSNKINLYLLQRSGDFFLGVPQNIQFYSLLTILLAKITGYSPGEFVHNIVDSHIYTNHIDQCKELIKRDPFPLPKLEINNRLNRSGFNGLLDLNINDFNLINYKSHPALKGKMSV